MLLLFSCCKQETCFVIVNKHLDTPLFLVGGSQTYCTNALESWHVLLQVTNVQAARIFDLYPCLFGPCWLLNSNHTRRVWTGALPSTSVLTVSMFLGLHPSAVCVKSSLLTLCSQHSEQPQSVWKQHLKSTENCTGRIVPLTKEVSFCCSYAANRRLGL